MVGRVPVGMARTDTFDREWPERLAAERRAVAHEASRHEPADLHQDRSRPRAESLEVLVKSTQPARDELLTPAGVAALLFVDPKTVTRWAMAGKLSAIRTQGVTAANRKCGRDGHPGRTPPTPCARRGSGPPSTAHGLRERGLLSGEPDREAAAAVVTEAVAVALEAVAAEAAEAVLVTAAAVTDAARRAADAGRDSQRGTGVRRRCGRRSVAREAVRTATRVRIRAEEAGAAVRDCGRGHRPRHGARRRVGGQRRLGAASRVAQSGRPLRPRWRTRCSPRPRPSGPCGSTAAEMVLETDARASGGDAAREAAGRDAGGAARTRRSGSSDPAVVPQARVELATFRLGGGCSIH